MKTTTAKTSMKTRKILAGAILASSGFLAAGASADIITHWDWTSDGGFIISDTACNNADCNLNFDNTSGVTPSGIAGAASIISWGTPVSGGNGEQSGLQGVFGASGAGGFNAELLGSDPVNIPMFEQLVTDGGWTNTGAAVHYNNEITIAGGFMDTTTLSTTFQLLTPGAGPVNQTDIGIDFDETPNRLPCPGGNPHGTVCDDIYTVTDLLDPITFFIDGKLYRLSFRFMDGPGAIVDGNTIWTAETLPGTAVMFVQGRIDFIPVPGILALMGMGLLMLGWRVRGRKVS